MIISVQSCSPPSSPVIAPQAAVLAELASANCMIDELKAAYGKSVRDASVRQCVHPQPPTQRTRTCARSSRAPAPPLPWLQAQKQAFAVQLDKAHADAVGLRAAFDASVADAKVNTQVPHGLQPGLQGGGLTCKTAVRCCRLRLC